jgi:FG-GAP repeat/FG-GAP-like repeat
MRSRRSFALVLLTTGSMVAAAGPAAHAHASHATRAPGRGAPRPGLADFNGDGHDDLAVGAPETSVSGQARAGSVHVLYGSSNGLTAAGDQRFTQATTGIPGAPGFGDDFGASVVAGDCNNDGFSDLAIGAYGETVNGHAEAGTVTLIEGSSQGLDPTTAVRIDERAFGGAVETHDRYGFAAAMGDFNGNGTDDLAVGGPDEGVHGVGVAGAIGVLTCSKTGGLQTTGGHLFTENHFSHHTATAEAKFGSALATGDLDGDGIDDLAIGAPGAVDGSTSSGSVSFLYGSASGIDGGATGSDFLAGALQGATTNDNMQFGLTLATGDVLGSGIDDVAVGAWGTQVGSKQEAGEVFVMPGKSGGPNGVNPVILNEDTPGVPSPVQAFDAFGWVVAIGDVGNGSRADLAVTAPQEVVSGDTSAGAVFVLYGGNGDPGSGGVEEITQDTAGVPGTEAQGTYWTIDGGLHVVNLGNGGTGDLAVGIPQDYVSGHGGSGSVDVFYGRSGSGLVGGTVQRWNTATSGVLGDPTTTRLFGFSLS